MLSPLLVNLSFLSTKPTGITTYAANLFSHLEPLNPTLLISQAKDNFSYYPVPANLTPDQGTKGHFQRLIWTQLQLPKIYRQLKSNLLFSPLPEAPLFAGCRYVVMVHDFIPLRFPRPFSPLTNYSRFYIPQVLAQAEHIVCNSVATAEDITNFLGISSQKITPILLAYDRDRFQFLNLPTSNYFLYIGRHDPYKNLQRLIAAFAALPTPDYELWLAGSFDQRYTPSLIAQVEELGIKERVKFLDYVPYSKLPVLINQAIALVFPTLWEGFGLPALEAMACGTPVITSNLSSLPEVVGDAGILVNPYKTEEITEAMRAIATDRKWRSHLCQASLIRASQFSWAKTGKATVELLEKFL